MQVDKRRWYPLTYNGVHVSCRKCHIGKIWYRCDDTLTIYEYRCDNCSKEFDPDQLELFTP